MLGSSCGEVSSYRSAFWVRGHRMRLASVFPCALINSRTRKSAQTSGESRRENDFCCLRRCSPDGAPEHIDEMTTSSAQSGSRFSTRHILDYAIETLRTAREARALHPGYRPAAWRANERPLATAPAAVRTIFCPFHSARCPLALSPLPKIRPFRTKDLLCATAIWRGD